MKRAIEVGIIIALTVTMFGCSSSYDTKSGAIGLREVEFEVLDSLMISAPRPIAIFLHAEWCKFCKNMEYTTLEDACVIAELNEAYYFISFDGESKAPVSFRNQSFKYVPTGRNTGTHQLAVALGAMNENLTYPTFVILNEKYEIVFQHNSYISADEMKAILENANG